MAISFSHESVADLGSGLQKVPGLLARNLSDDEKQLISITRTWPEKNLNTGYVEAMSRVVEVGRAGQVVYYLAPVAWGMLFILLIGTSSEYVVQFWPSAPSRRFLFGGYFAVWCFSIYHAAMAIVFGLCATLDSGEQGSERRYVKLLRLSLELAGTPNSIRRERRLFYWFTCGLVLASIWFLVYCYCSGMGAGGFDK